MTLLRHRLTLRAGPTTLRQIITPSKNISLTAVYSKAPLIGHLCIGAMRLQFNYDMFILFYSTFTLFYFPFTSLFDWHPVSNLEGEDVRATYSSQCDITVTLEIM